MKGVGELAVAAGWRLLPVGWRTALATRIAVVQSRCLPGVPRSPTLVLAHSAESAKRFPEAVRLEDSKSEHPPYSLLSTCYNERATIVDFLDSVLRQSAQPRELIIADGGSADGTPGVIEAWLQAHSELPFRVHLIGGKRLNISEGRNQAAAAAQEALFLFADAGTTLDRMWASRLLDAFVVEPKTEVACGWYQPIRVNALQAAAAEYLLPRWDAIDPETFLPSARSVAMRRGAFERTGGFPEFLTRAGEDTLFGYFLKSAARHWAFVPDALAFWKLPATRRALFGTVVSYARGDAELPVLFGSYYPALLGTALKAVIEFALLLLFLLLSAWFGGSIFRIAALVVGVSLLLRLVGLLISYRAPSGSRVPGMLRAQVVLGMAAAQVWGFGTGLKSRSKVEMRRLANLKAPSSGAPEAHSKLILMLLPRALGAFTEQPDLSVVQRALGSGCSVTVVAGQGPPVGDEYALLYAHQNLSQYVRSAFDLQRWLSNLHAHGMQNCAVADLCGERWSAEIAEECSRSGMNVIARDALRER